MNPRPRQVRSVISSVVGSLTCVGVSRAPSPHSQILTALADLHAEGLVHKERVARAWCPLVELVFVAGAGVALGGVTSRLPRLCVRKSKLHRGVFWLKRVRQLEAHPSAAFACVGAESQARRLTVGSWLASDCPRPRPLLRSMLQRRSFAHRARRASRRSDRARLLFGDPRERESGRRSAESPAIREGHLAADARTGKVLSGRHKGDDFARAAPTLSRATPPPHECESCCSPPLEQEREVWAPWRCSQETSTPRGRRCRC